MRLRIQPGSVTAEIMASIFAKMYLATLPTTKEVDSARKEFDASLLPITRLSLPYPHSSSVLGSSTFSREAHESLTSTKSRLEDVLGNSNKFTNPKLI